MAEGRNKRRFDLAEANIDEDDLNREFRQDPSGGTDIPYRVKDQDRDGVAAEVLYPNSLLTLFGSRDPAYQIGVARGIQRLGNRAVWRTLGQVCTGGDSTGDRRGDGGGRGASGGGAGLQADQRADTPEVPAV